MAAFVLILAMLSWLTILPGTPRIYAPINLLVFLPLFILYEVLDERVATFLAVTIVPILFFTWSLPVLRGSPIVPTRSIVLLICAVLASASLLLFGYQVAVEYHGATYFIGVALINIFCWFGLGALSLIVRQRPSVGRSLGFHFALFAWLAWCAFPYLGELP